MYSSKISIEACSVAEIYRSDARVEDLPQVDFTEGLSFSSLHRKLMWTDELGRALILFESRVMAREHKNGTVQN